MTFAGAAVAAGCASQPEPRPATLDPANPAAPESPPPAVSRTLVPDVHAAEHEHGASKEADAAASEHQHGATKDASATAFTCPMDPEVVSPKPGHCPKCGMNLVPKGASGSGHSH